MKQCHLLKILHEASKSQHQFKVGALTLERGKIVSRGFNRHSVYSAAYKYRQGVCTIHAEQIALRRTGNRKVDTLMVVRINSSGLSMAKPCKRCYALAEKSGIKKIIYSNFEGEFVVRGI